jgi:1,2-diacylglycerol 3-alpha-glucosyltransferase
MRSSCRNHLHEMNQIHIAIIWQRFLPYHVARIRQAHNRLSELDFRLTVIEVASQDASYGFPRYAVNDMNYVCCFPVDSYHEKSSKEVCRKVLNVLNDVRPDLVLAPAIAFPEGIASLAYRLKSGARSVVMDDAWDHTDRKGFVTQFIKRLIYKNADAAFVPAVSHLSYYKKLGFEEKRVIFGVDVVDNDYFARQVNLVRLEEDERRVALQLPRDYFLFVGRVLPRKGLETLLEAYKQYRDRAKGVAWDLVLVGEGTYLVLVKSKFTKLSGVCFVDAQFGDNLCEYYGLAKAMIVPSDSDPWGLVVNEAMASGLPVIVSSGCGAAKTLVKEGENGWTFKFGNDTELAQLMLRVSSLSGDALKEMGEKSRSIVADWSLDRFADGVLKAIEIPRRQPAGIISDIMTKLWRGRVRTT